MGEKRGNIIDSYGKRREQGVYTKVANLLNKIYQVFFGELTKGRISQLLIYFSLISLLEILAYGFQGIFSILAAWCWLFTGLICTLAIGTYFIQAIIRDARERHFTSLAGVLLLLLLLLSFWGNINVSDINPDATQQAAAGLDSFQVRDLNYTGKAFLGYPNRQYILNALPAFLFGRSIFTLHMGFGYPFLLSLMLMYSAFTGWARKMNLHSNITILPLYAFLVFPFITEYYANFEQAFNPVSFTCLGIGFFLLFIIEPNVINSIGLGWIGCLLSNSYTPALASLGLLMVFLALIILGFLTESNLLPFPVQAPKLVAKASIMIEINIIIFLVATFMGKREDRIMELRSDINPVKTSLESIYAFLTDKHAAFLGAFGIIVILYLAVGLTYRLKLRDFLLSMWILGVVAVSNLMLGYISYEAAWVLQRSMIIIPVIITGVTLTIFDFMSKYKIKAVKGCVAVIAITFTLIGIHNFNQPNQSFLYFHYVQPMKYMWKDLEGRVKEKGLEVEDEFNLVLYTDNILIRNLADYCKFFYPNASLYTPEQGEYPPDIDTRLRTFIYGDSPLPALTDSTKLEMKTFENKKYNETISWYLGIAE